MKKSNQLIQGLLAVGAVALIALVILLVRDEPILALLILVLGGSFAGVLVLLWRQVRSEQRHRWHLSSEVSKVKQAVVRPIYGDQSREGYAQRALVLDRLAKLESALIVDERGRSGSGS